MKQLRAERLEVFVIAELDGQRGEDGVIDESRAEISQCSGGEVLMMIKEVSSDEVV